MVKLIKTKKEVETYTQTSTKNKERVKASVHTCTQKETDRE